MIYDAEDRPEPKQLKKAVHEFSKASTKLICLQARVNFYNKRNGMLSRLMSAEYRLWYDEFLAALDVIESPVPLGGTSNHFRVLQLRKIGGWDSYNVTEDADLGVRIFKREYRTKMLNSITLEECPTDVVTWIKQRSRWIKGHIQTYLVHARTSKVFFTKKTYFAYVSFNCFLLVPFLSFLCTFLLMFISIVYRSSVVEIVHQYDTLTSANLFFWLALCWSTFFWVTKNMTYKWRAWVVFLSPFYFGLHSIAAIIASVELYLRPYFWSKTKHNHKTGRLREEYIWTGQKLKKLLKSWKKLILRKKFIR